MPPGTDTQLGQLAIARGLVTLSDLLRCVELTGRTGRDLANVLVSERLLNEAQLTELRRRIEAGHGDDLQRELEQGKTIVMDELVRSQVAGVRDTLDASHHTGVGVGADVTDAEFDLELEHDDRYEILGELGRGGMGEVLEARDKILQRTVALKQLVANARDEKGRQRLMMEAQVTGVLEHPSIVPVYDLQATREGEPFYTMRIIRERSLEQLLTQMKHGEDSTSLTHLVSVLRQVSLAVQFAHDLGVVHRDLKPENILVGKYGEVFVIDWGIAKVLRQGIGFDTTERAAHGSLVGTPSYMAPEQARGDHDAIDGRTDVYALGATLYEILTLEPVFDADHVLALLFQVVNEPPVRPSERAPERRIPTELEEICLRALAKDPQHRYQSAQEFADELELFLEGVKDRDRRRQMAQQALEEAEQGRAVYAEVRTQYLDVLGRLQRERRHVESWAPAEQKQDLWALEQQAEDLRVEIEHRFGETVRGYGQALVHLPDMPEARRRLADLYWQRFQEAETAGDRAQAAYFEGLVRQYNDGAYDRLLEGQSTLTVTTDAPATSISLHRFQEVQRRLVPWHVADLGSAPVTNVPVPHGTYLLRLTAPERVAMDVPVLVERVEDVHLNLKMYSHSRVPDEFVVVSRGEFVSGHTHEIGSLAERRKYLPDFAIMRYPVTCRQYLEFLNDLARVDLETAKSHCPSRKDELYWELSDGVFRLPANDPEGDNWEPDWPMIMVSYFDAVAYAVWRSHKEGRPYRLPTIDEWEKAARGVDGRTYSWGNHFDASFCRMRDSKKGKPVPEPVGSFATDCSPYGVMDVCGNVAEWTASSEEGTSDVKYLGGASFNSFAEMCRLDFKMTSPTNYAFVHYGFRLALSLD